MVTTWCPSVYTGILIMPFSSKHHFEVGLFSYALSSEHGNSKTICWWDVTFRVGETGQHSDCTDESLIPYNARPSSLYLPPTPLKTHPEDAGETGQDTQCYHGVAGFHAAGTTDVAQGGIAAAGSNTSYADVQVNCWAKGRASLGDTLVTVTAWRGERKQEEKSGGGVIIYIFNIFYIFFADFNDRLAVQCPVGNKLFVFVFCWALSHCVIVCIYVTYGKHLQALQLLCCFLCQRNAAYSKNL